MSGHDGSEMIGANVQQIIQRKIRYPLIIRIFPVSSDRMNH